MMSMKDLDGDVVYLRLLLS